MAFYMDILAPIIEEYPKCYANSMKDESYMEEAPHISFLELCMKYEKHIQQWLLKVEDFSHLEVVHIEDSFWSIEYTKYTKPMIQSKGWNFKDIFKSM